jgi:hypothetical protein
MTRVIYAQYIYYIGFRSVHYFYFVIWNGKGEIDTKDSFQEVGPLVRNPQKSLWNKLFYRNFIGIVRVQSFVPKDSIEKFPIGFKSYKNPPLFSL